MNEIFVTWTGDGTAFVDNYYPNEGDTITLTCIPDPHCTLIDILATDGGGYPIALYVTEIQQFTYHVALGNVTIDVTFSDTPFIYKNLWLLATRKWWQKKNY